jgi:hypothetical protein
MLDSGAGVLVETLTGEQRLRGSAVTFMQACNLQLPHVPMYVYSAYP